MQNNIPKPINQFIIHSLYFALSSAVELNIILIPVYIKIDKNPTIAINLKVLYHDAITFLTLANPSVCPSPEIKSIPKIPTFPENISSQL